MLHICPYKQINLLLYSPIEITHMSNLHYAFSESQIMNLSRECNQETVAQLVQLFSHCQYSEGALLAQLTWWLEITTKPREKEVEWEWDLDDKENWTQQRGFCTDIAPFSGNKEPKWLHPELFMLRKPIADLIMLESCKRGWHQDTRLHVSTPCWRGRGVMCSVGDGWRPSQLWKVKVILCFAVVLTACALNQSWRGSKINCAASSLLCVSSAGHVCEACPLIVGINTVAEDVRHRWALKRPAPSPLV